jgi:hypothetical protein
MHGDRGGIWVFDNDGRRIWGNELCGPVVAVAFDPGSGSFVWVEARPLTWGVKERILHRTDSETFEDLAKQETLASWWRFVDSGLAVSHDFASVSLWHAPTLTRLRTIPMPGLVEVALAPDGKHLAVADRLRVRVLRIAR